MERYKSHKEIVMPKQARFVALPIAVLVILILLTAGPAYSARKMPSFKLEDVTTGKMVDSKTFKGKSLLITFFATWCPPCIQEIPNLIDLQKKYGPRNFSVLGLSVDQEGKEVVKDLVTRKKINYPVLMADNAVTRNFGGVYGIPTSFLVNSKGKVVKKYTGYVPHSVLVRDIEKIIN